MKNNAFDIVYDTRKLNYLPKHHIFQNIDYILIA